jgi:hypothetical protein
MGVGLKPEHAAADPGPEILSPHRLDRRLIKRNQLGGQDRARLAA